MVAQVLTIPDSYVTDRCTVFRMRGDVQESCECCGTNPLVAPKLDIGCSPKAPEVNKLAYSGPTKEVLCQRLPG